MNAELLHRLGTALALAAGAAWTVWSLAALRRERRGRGRMAALLGVRCARRPARRPLYGAWARRWTAPVAAALAGYVLVEGLIGGAAAVACAYGVWRWQRRPRPLPDNGRAVQGLPLAADLLAACLSAGAGPREAAEAVGESLGGPVGERLARTAAELRLGGEPAEAWGGFAAIPGALGLARCLERASASGAPAADAVSRLAAGLRAERERSAAARAQRAQVLITAPVGLCFLPAFLAVGVAPVLVGLAGGLL
ncbi:type II secretion system F family protein [Streptomyces sp. NPDC006307]|uniref:type II secretion system F family protein n=1 Tax=Streptomyces sp. NPDC006307 TaxID=3156748 RepID=UPI0033A844E7